MCVTQVFIDQYVDGEEVVHEKLLLCNKSYGDNPCEESYEDEYPIRRLPYTRDSASRSSASSSQRTPSIIEVIDEAEAPRRSSSSSRRRSKKPFSGLVFNAFFGQPPRRRRSRRERSRSVSVERRSVVIEQPTVRLPRAMTPPPPPPIFRGAPVRGPTPVGRPFTPSSPVSPVSPATPVYASRYVTAPVIVDASPRSRGRPVIVDNRDRDNDRRARRSDSTEVHVTISRTASRERSPSPLSYEDRQRLVREAADEERRRRRDTKIARLDSEVSEAQRRRQQQQYRQLHDAEISARPPRPVIQQEMPIRGIRRAPRTVDVAPRRPEILDDLNLSRRGEEVIASAIAYQERADSRVDEEAREAERQKDRLRRRFSDASEAGPSRPAPRRRERERIVYPDGTYSYRRVD